jgi:hypothetical protein
MTGPSRAQAPAGDYPSVEAIWKVLGNPAAPG